MADKYINKVLEEYTHTYVDKQMRDEFHSWLTNEEYTLEKEQALLSLWKQTDNIPTESTLQSFDCLLKTNNQQEKKRARRFIPWRYAAAVALILSVGAWWWFGHTASTDVKWVEYFTQTGDSGIVTLPDGSQVHTNTGTILLYPETFGKDNRMLYIAGEANFKVIKNANLPFIVRSKNFSVTALGTEFDVTSYPGDASLKVTLISGSVKVEWEETLEEVLLTPSEQFVYNHQSHQFTVGKVDLQDATAWQRGELVFRGAIIQDVLDALQKKYSVSFQYPSNLFNADKYNFRFREDASLPYILDIIKVVSGNFDYKESGDIYYLSPHKTR